MGVERERKSGSGRPGVWGMRDCGGCEVSRVLQCQETWTRCECGEGVRGGARRDCLRTLRCVYVCVMHMKAASPAAAYCCTWGAHMRGPCGWSESLFALSVVSRDRGTVHTPNVGERRCVPSASTNPYYDADIRLEIATSGTWSVFPPRGTPVATSLFKPPSRFEASTSQREGTAVQQRWSLNAPRER